MVPRPETGTIDAPGLAGAEPGTLQPQTERPVRPTSLVPILTGARKWKYITLATLWIAASAFFWGWWLRPGNVLNPWLYALVTLSMLWVYFMQLYFVLVFLRARRSGAALPEPGQWRVAMIVTKTPSEPFEVLERARCAQCWRRIIRMTPGLPMRIHARNDRLVPGERGEDLVAQGRGGLSPAGLAAARPLQGRQPRLFLRSLGLSRLRHRLAAGRRSRPPARLSA